MANYTKRDERAETMRQEMAKAKSPMKRSRAIGKPATLGEEIRGTRKWRWFECRVCGRRTPKALAPFAIRWGMNVAVTDIAKLAKCASCGHVGMLMQIPAQTGIGSEMEIEPFPAELATRGLERWVSRVTRTKLPAPARSGEVKRDAI